MTSATGIDWKCELHNFQKSQVYMHPIHARRTCERQGGVQKYANDLGVYIPGLPCVLAGCVQILRV